MTDEHGRPNTLIDMASARTMEVETAESPGMIVGVAYMGTKVTPKENVSYDHEACKHACSKNGNGVDAHNSETAAVSVPCTCL